jgi:hypothetical protein
VKSYARGRIGPDDTLVLAPAADLPAALAAIADGAELIDLWQATAETVAAVRGRHPAGATCAPADGVGLVRDLATAQRTGAILICSGLAEAVTAGASGIDRSRLLVEASPDRATGLLSAGWRVIVTADDPAADDPATTDPTTDEEAGGHTAAAVAAMACWLGAAAVRTRYVTAARRAIAMTAAIKAAAPPAS